MQHTPLLRAQQLDINDATTQQARHGLHGLVIAQRVEDTLTTGMGEVHVFVVNAPPSARGPR